MATVLTLRFEFRVNNTLTDPTALVLSDSTGAYGIRKTGGVNVLAAATDISGGQISTGVYEYEFTEANGAAYEQAYTSYIKATYDSLDYYFDEDHAAVSEPGASILTTYGTLLEEIGEDRYGIRTGFSSEQTSKITRCMKHGLNRVYAAHEWSFFRPNEPLTTSSPYDTGTVTIVDGVVTLAVGTFPSWAALGLIKVDSSYYRVDTRDSDSQVTLQDTSLDADAGSSYELSQVEYDLPTGFESIENELTYQVGDSSIYPPIEMRHDVQIRTWQQDNPYTDRPRYFSIRMAHFDATVGSRRRISFYPLANAAYVIKARMTLKQTMLDSTNQYPVGGEQLSQLIVEACLAAAEAIYDESFGVHEQRYLEMLPLAIAADQRASSPTSLGGDAPQSERGHSGSRAARMGSISLNGDTL